MNRRDDPYTPGSGRRPLKLAGRDEELEELRLVLERVAAGTSDRSLIFSGLRGVGKTVLLLEYDLLAREQGWSSTDVREVSPQADFRTTFAELAFGLLRSMSRKERMRSRARRALGVVKAFSLGAPGLTARIDVEAATGTADSGDPEGDLAALLVEVGEVARAGGTGALFLVDEMHNLRPEALGAVAMAFHRLSQRALPVVLVGAGLPPLPRLLFQAKPYAERLFTYRELGRLSDGAAHAALAGPAALRDVAFEQDAVRLAIEGSGGYPYFLQEYGRVLWREAEGSPITEADVRAAQPIVEESLDRDFFRNRFESASDAEQRYLAAMADLGDGPQRSAEVSARAGYRARSHSSLHRDNLLKKELIYSPRRGLVDFTVPRFADYLRREHPLAGFA